MPDAIIACEFALRHAGPEALLVQLDRLAAWAKSFNIPHDPQAMPAAYADLATLPPDLLVKAFDAAMATSTDTFRLPLPARIRAGVTEDLDRRRRVRTGLYQMERAPVDRKVQRTPEERAIVDAAMAKMRANMAAGSAYLQGFAKPATAPHDGEA